MRLKLYQIDAFATQCFEGNPAAVCPLNDWLPDPLMQSIAEENNLSETVFFVAKDGVYHIRWFTPTHEVELCGHATLASAYVIFNILGFTESEINFESKSGPLTVKKKTNGLEMDFPSQAPVKCGVPEDLLSAFNVTPLECLKSADYILVFENETDVLNAKPDLSKLSKLDLRGVIITSKSRQYDFILRFFAPKYAINEDPVTGSALTQLTPYWAEKLDNQILSARQVSKRGGDVNCVYDGARVKISGNAVQYMEAEIVI